ncbi:hypothetical protein [Enterovibrio norvegicus]|uniref:hypothetical protein n=1 Tax=Enterovibrio norvegicus TaxID=188144 RepID=UPI000C83A249|nr:hypothetical protein [Enterovibrio norvegicus]PMN70273.1 hypothetical protein BCT27_18190 [Enterovibrio norvegicus]
MFNKKLTAVALSMVLTGCMTVAELCPPDTKIEMETAGIPAKTSDERTVIVLPVDMEFEDVAKSRLQAVLRNDLESVIAGTGAKLVDRKSAEKLKGEIKLAEQSGRYNKSGVPIADIAVITEVTASKLSSSFSEAYTYKNDDGETKFVPAKCRFDTEVNAVAKVVTLPDMSLVKRIEFSASKYNSTETSNSRCPISNQQYTGMASEAAEDAVAYNFELQKLLAPSAPVMEMRQCEAGTMVKIAMGSKQKIAPKLDVVFSQIFKSDEGDIETYTLGEGYVVNNEMDAVKQNFSWVVIEEELSLKIRKGDLAKVVPEECPILNPMCHLNQLGL